MLQFSSAHTEAISQRITELFGLLFPPNREVDLMRAVSTAARNCQIKTEPEQLMHWLVDNTLKKEEVSALSEALTINETYFFREKTALELLSETIIPYIIASRDINEKPIRIWSAGCSSGEEPYSIVMWLFDRFAQLSSKNLHVLATDISPVVINKALTGEYSEWSFRETETATREKYFKKDANKNRIKAEVKKSVTFSYLNLSKNSYPSASTNTENMDVIFCRNVLMYFSPEVIKEVSHRFFNALTNKGWFISSQVELNDDYFGNFKRISFRNGIYYSKYGTSEKRGVKIEMFDSDAFSENKPYARTIKKIPSENKPIRKEVTFSNQQKQAEVQTDTKPLPTLIAKSKRDTTESAISTIKELSNRGEYDLAIELIRYELDTNRGNADLYYLYANILYEKNELEQVENLLTKTLYINHNHLDAALLMAYTLKQRKKNEQSIRYFRQAISIISNDELQLKKEEEKMSYERLITMVQNEIAIINA